VRRKPLPQPTASDDDAGKASAVPNCHRREYSIDYQCLTRLWGWAMRMARSVVWQCDHTWVITMTFLRSGPRAAPVR
jgi:hypothetical protein